MRFLLTLAYEICLIVISAFIGRLVSAHVRIIPQFVAHLSEIVVTDSDFRTACLVLVVGMSLVFAVSHFLRGTKGIFFEAKRTSREIYALILGFTLASIALFLGTNAVFSPELLLSTALSAFLLFVLSFAAGRAVVGSGRATQIPSAAASLAVELVRALRSPFAVGILIFAIAPILLAKAFTSSREFANLVTHFRESLVVSSDTPYQLTNAFPGTFFLQPIDVQFPPDGAPVAYVLERRGALWRINLDGTHKELLIDFSNRVGVVEVEDGALGLALHPEFGRAGSPSHGSVYVYYTDASQPKRQVNRLVRFNLDLATAEQRTASEAPLIEIDRRYPDGYHNGGSVTFGPDGFLYLAVGDGEDNENHQRIDLNLLGGIFRIDVDRRGGGISHPIRVSPKNGTTQDYFIPNDNPFIGVSGALEEYWALGFRNPFRMSFDAVSGRLWAGDVGNDGRFGKWQKINLVEKGSNYQYPYIEGFGENACCEKPKSIIGKDSDPVYYYHNSATDRAVIGGTVYHGEKLPELRDKYIFADVYSGRIWAFPADAERVQHVDLLARSTQIAQFGVVKLTNGPGGELFVTALGGLHEQNGQVLKLAKAGTAPPQDTGLGQEAAQRTADGREIFNQNCTRCHGTSGNGLGPDVERIGIKLADFTNSNYPSIRSEEEAMLIVRKGGEAVGLNPLMPAWQEILDEPQTKAVVKYVRELSRGH